MKNTLRHGLAALAARRKVPQSATRRCGALLLAALASALVACSPPRAVQGHVTPDVAAALARNREAALAAALPMPGVDRVQAHELAWDDTTRQRQVLARLYLPAQARGPVPLVVFSHGIGGSRNGYTYLGKHWAAQGYASLHLQHAGSDRALWGGNPLTLLNRLQDAASDAEAIDRAVDWRFALDQVLAGPLGQHIDAQRIVAAGHSYGANTTLLVAGAQVRRDGRLIDLRDARVRAAVLISAPPFYGESDPAAILRHVRVPTLHVTSTADDIRIPGYYSGVKDRTDVFDATGSQHKALAVFKDGSHSIFTDRLGTGGAELNPKVKAATRELAVAFFGWVLKGEEPSALTQWSMRHAPLLDSFRITQR